MEKKTYRILEQTFVNGVLEKEEWTTCKDCLRKPTVGESSYDLMRTVKTIAKVEEVEDQNENAILGAGKVVDISDLIPVVEYKNKCSVCDKEWIVRSTNGNVCPGITITLSYDPSKEYCEEFLSLIEDYGSESYICFRCIARTLNVKKLSERV